MDQGNRERRSGAGVLRIAAGWVVAVGLFLGLWGHCQGYVMPARQLLEFAGAHFEAFETLIVTHTVEIQAPGAESQRTHFDQRIWIKAPDRIHAEWLDRGSGEDRISDTVSRLLFVNNSEDDRLRFLARLGINTEAVGFARLGDLVSYRIGDRGAESPRLLIDKRKFYPLLLCYRPGNVSGPALITVRFEDYRKKDGGFYPFKTTCEFGDGTIQTCFVSDIRPNAEVDPSLFPSIDRSVPPRVPPGPEPAAPEEERLKEVIESLEREYR